MDKFEGNENDYAMKAEELKFLQELRVHIVVCNNKEASVKFAEKFLERSDNPFSICIRVYASLVHEDRLLDILFTALTRDKRAPKPKESKVMLDLAMSKRCAALESVMTAFRFKENKQHMIDKIMPTTRIMDPEIITKFVIDLDMAEDIDMKPYPKSLLLKGYFEQVDNLLRLHSDWSASLVSFLDGILNDNVDIDKKKFDEANESYQAVMKPDAAELVMFLQK